MHGKMKLHRSKIFYGYKHKHLEGILTLWQISKTTVGNSPSEYSESQAMEF